MSDKKFQKSFLFNILASFALLATVLYLNANIENIFSDRSRGLASEKEQSLKGDVDQMVLDLVLNDKAHQQVVFGKKPSASQKFLLERLTESYNHNAISKNKIHYTLKKDKTPLVVTDTDELARTVGFYFFGGKAKVKSVSSLRNISSDSDVYEVFWENQTSSLEFSYSERNELQSIKIIK